jgi:Fic family protein
VYPPDKLLISDPALKRLQEVKNGLLQYDELRAIAESQFGSFRLTPSIIQRLQKAAVQGIYSDAGQFRTWPVSIENTAHKPPEADSVAGLVQEMCDHANAHANLAEAIYCAAYLLWRLNWIHPFGDGNGRTSRAISYLALNACYGFHLPGTVTVTDLIAADRQPYYAALDQADAAWTTGRVNVSELHKLLYSLLQIQLKSAI